MLTGVIILVTAQGNTYTLNIQIKTVFFARNNNMVINYQFSRSITELLPRTGHPHCCKSQRKVSLTARGFRNKNTIDNYAQVHGRYNKTCFLLRAATRTAAVAYCSEERNSAVGAHVTSYITVILKAAQRDVALHFLPARSS